MRGNGTLADHDAAFGHEEIKLVVESHVLTKGADNGGASLCFLMLTCAVFQRRKSGDFFKILHKIGDRSISAGEADLRYRIRRGIQSFFA